MSVITTYQIVCDLCQESLKEERYVMENRDDFRPPQPNPMYRYSARGSKWDLCNNCMYPLDVAIENRIKWLRETGKLKGAPQ